MKLQAIWKILTSEHYIVLTASGGCVAHYPKNLDAINWIKNLAEQVLDQQEERLREEKRENPEKDITP